MMAPFDAAAAAGLFGLTFVLEDAAVLSGAVLAASSKIAWAHAFAICATGVWLGDLGIYFLARLFGRAAVGRLRRGRSAEELISRGEELFAKFGWTALVVCRFVPGSRVPTYATAGLLRMPTFRFAAVTGVLAVCWVALVFALVATFGRAAPAVLGVIGHSVGWVLAAAALAACVWICWKLAERIRFAFRAGGQWKHWEFWPAWFFYIPVALHYVRLAVKHRSLTLPTCANPGIHLGGMIGESKFTTLDDLQRAVPDFVARTALLPPGGVTDRLPQLQKLSFPFVLKPDVGQRGSGFRVIRFREDAERYLGQVPGAIVCQEYVEGPLEFGLFYVRRPGDECGHIVGITEKIFPIVTGDGVSSLAELVRSDPRAAILEHVYLERLDGARVPAAGERIRLVEAGNHAQGCIFRDGADLLTPELEAQIDAISRAIPGFFVGRYDIRATSLEELKAGRGFKILELNGAAAECTNAYDARKTLRQAYAILFGQWDMIFEVAALNRRNGERPADWTTLLQELADYRVASRSYPRAD